jgi:Domain of unknown function (DUF4388)
LKSCANLLQTLDKTLTGNSLKVYSGAIILKGSNRLVKDMQKYFRHFAILLSEIEANATTGKLTCRAEDGRVCVLYFTGGQLVHAVSETQVGEDVIYDMMSWGQGLFELITAPPSPEQSIDINQIAIIHQTIKLFQAKGVFNKVFTTKLTPLEKEIEPVGSAPMPEAVTTTAQPDDFLHSISKPVEWEFNLSEVVPKIAPNKPTAPVTPQTIPEIELNTQEDSGFLVEPVNIEINFPGAVSQTQPKTVETAGKSTPKTGSPAFFLPQGRSTEPTLRLNSFRLADLVRKTASRWKTAWVYVLIKVAKDYSILLFEQGNLIEVRYLSETENLRSQAAYNKLEAVVTNQPSEVSIYEVEKKLLAAYRTLLSGDSLINGGLAHTLDVKALVQEQMRLRATIALRFYNADNTLFYFLYKGENLGSWQVVNNRLERGGDLTPLLRDTSIKLDMLASPPPDKIAVDTPQKLASPQVSILTEAISSILQSFALLSGQEKLLNNTRKLLNESATLFPCLQRVGVGLSGDRITVFWTVDQAQAFVNQTEAQNAFNFVLSALLTQHQELMGGMQTVKEVARRAIQTKNIDLAKEGLLLNCLT